MLSSTSSPMKRRMALDQKGSRRAKKTSRGRLGMYSPPTPIASRRAHSDSGVWHAQTCVGGSPPAPTSSREEGGQLPALIGELGDVVGFQVGPLDPHPVYEVLLVKGCQDRAVLQGNFEKHRINGVDAVVRAQRVG